MWLDIRSRCLNAKRIRVKCVTSLQRQQGFWRSGGFPSSLDDLSVEKSQVNNDDCVTICSRLCKYLQHAL